MKLKQLVWTTDKNHFYPFSSPNSQICFSKKPINDYKIIFDEIDNVKSNFEIFIDSKFIDTNNSTASSLEEAKKFCEDHYEKHIMSLFDINQDIETCVNLEFIEEYYLTENSQREEILALLLINDVIFLNTNWHREDLSEQDKKLPRLLVNCNDVFMWACADAENIDLKDINDLYEHFIKDPIWGAAIWCCKRRKYMPQPPLEQEIIKAGIWDLDSMGLDKNFDALTTEEKEEFLLDLNQKKI
jgi:hypothetical protein